MKHQLDIKRCFTFQKILNIMNFTGGNNSEPDCIVQVFNYGNRYSMFYATQGFSTVKALTWRTGMSLKWERMGNISLFLLNIFVNISCSVTYVLCVLRTQHFQEISPDMSSK